jgi:hypothetical protein
MRKTSSTEFMEWQMFLKMRRWEQRTKQDYYLAQIAAEIRAIRFGFSGKKEGVSIEDCILQDSDKPASPHSGRPEIECGPEAMRDPRWAAVNSEAKSQWAKRIGGIETLPESTLPPGFNPFAELEARMKKEGKLDG